MITITVNGNDVQQVAKVIENKNNAIAAYKTVRREVMIAIKNFLAQSKKGFTAKELSDKFGLSTNTIASMSIDYGIKRRDRRVTYRYVRLTDVGEVDLDDIKEVTYKCKEYYVI